MLSTRQAPRRKRGLWAGLLLALVAGFALLFSLQPWGAPRARAAVAADPVVAAVGDIACDPTSPLFNRGRGRHGVCIQSATYAVAARIRPTAVLALGDTQYNCGGYQAFLRSYALSWGHLQSITHPVTGNHEYLPGGGTDCDPSEGAGGYFRYYGAAAGEPGKGWYSFNLGSWHLIALNSSCGLIGGCGPRSAEGEWLANDLAAHQNLCTLAFWHIPLNSSGGNATINSYALWKQLYAAGTDVILNAHAHIYERFAPEAPPPSPSINSGLLDPTFGIREFIVGTGGANHTGLLMRAPNTEVRNATTFGVLRLTLHPSSYDWQFVPVAGATFSDAGSQSCHGSPG